MKATRAERYAEIKRLLAEGLSAKEIAAALGLSRGTVYDYLNDPDGSRARTRKDGYRRPCPGFGERAGHCGNMLDGSNGTGPGPTLCKICSPLAHKYWTRDSITDRFREFYRVTGRAPAVTDAAGFAPSLAVRMSVTRRREVEAAARLVKLPAVSTVHKVFGSWQAALDAAGLEQSAQGGAGHREPRCIRSTPAPVRDRMLYELAKGPMTSAELAALHGDDYRVSGRILGPLVQAGVVSRVRDREKRTVGVGYVYTLVNPPEGATPMPREFLVLKRNNDPGYWIEVGTVEAINPDQAVEARNSGAGHYLAVETRHVTRGEIAPVTRLSFAPTLDT